MRCIGYGRDIIHFHIVVVDDVEAPKAMGAGNMSWAPCFDVTISGDSTVSM